MNIPALPVDGHVTKILHTHAELSAFDAAHVDLPFDGALDPLTRRCQLWEELIDFVAMLGEDKEFASYFHQRRNLRNGFPTGDNPAVAAIEARLYEHTFDAAVADAPAARVHRAQIGARQAYRAMGSLVPLLNTWPTRQWVIRDNGLKIQHGSGAEDDAMVRRNLCDIAAAVGLNYRETREQGYTMAEAWGVVDQVPVSIWDHVATGNEPTAPRVRRTAPVTARWLALGRLMSLLEGEPVAFWVVRHDRLDIQFSGATTDRRAAMQQIARQLGVPYADGEPVINGKVRLEVMGDINGVAYRIWCHVDALCGRCAQPGHVAGDCKTALEPVDDGGALNDVGRDLAEEAAQRASTEREGQEELAAWERELLASATDPTPESAAEAEQLAATLAADAAAEEEHFAEVGAQFADCAIGDDQAAAAELGVDL